MYYEINVSENGKHLFATHERSLCTEDEARALAKRLKAAFPQCRVDMYRVERMSKFIVTL